VTSSGTSSAKPKHSQLREELLHNWRSHKGRSNLWDDDASLREKALAEDPDFEKLSRSLSTDTHEHRQHSTKSRNATNQVSCPDTTRDTTRTERSNRFQRNGHGLGVPPTTPGWGYKEEKHLPNTWRNTPNRTPLLWTNSIKQNLPQWGVLLDPKV